MAFSKKYPICLQISGFLCVISRYQELSKYGRTLTKRSSLANSFERDYPGGPYFASMTGRPHYDDERSRAAAIQKYREGRKYHEAYEHSNAGRAGYSYPSRDYATSRDYPQSRAYDQEYRAANGYYRYWKGHSCGI